MTALHPTMHAARLKGDIWRYRARRAVLRLMRRLLNWLDPEQRQAEERQGQGSPPCRG